jgi:type I restriction enzyme S subunit
MSSVAQLLVDHLDIWSGAVERKNGAGRGNGGKTSLYGIEKLRALILDLAVRGKLLPQDATDQPASELLKRIKNAKNSLERGKRAQAEKSFVAPTEFALPRGWSWTRLIDIAEINPRNEAPDDRDASFVPMPLVSTRIDGAHESEIRRWGEIKAGYTHFADGDIALAKITPCFENGKAALFQNLENGIGAGTTELHVARPYLDEVNRRYLLIVLKTPRYLVEGEANMTGTAGQKRVPRSYFELTPIPFPPVAEQARIVAKVDELMALCDALEAGTLEAMEAHEKLVRELLATLVNSQDPADLAANWSRIEANFEVLFSTEESIDALKRTILDIAASGRLAPSSPKDTDPTDRRRELGRARIQLKARSRDARIPDQIAPPGEPLGFGVPTHWQQAPFDELFLFVDYRGRTPPKSTDGVPLITAKNVRPGYLDREPREFIPNELFSDWMTRGFPRRGDLFFTTEAPLGNICLNSIEEPFAIAQRVICLQPYADLNTAFFMYVIMSPLFQRRLASDATGMTATGIKASRLKRIPLPFPPEEEQQRIVERVELLLNLCESAKQRLSDQEASCALLASALSQAATS